MRIKSAVSVTLWLAAAAVAGAQSPRDMDIKASDGVNLKATYTSPGKPGPAILLLHQCDMDRKAWTSAAAEFVARGIHVLAVDYRTYGESGGPRGDWQQLRPLLLEKWPGDIDAALRALMAQPGVDAGRIAAGGASCGVNNSIQLAKRSGKIKALVLLSGGPRDGGMEYLAANPNLAIYAASSKEESGIVERLREVIAGSRNPASRLEVLEVPGHGVPLFAAAPKLLPAIADWLAQQLR